MTPPPSPTKVLAITPGLITFTLRLLPYTIFYYIMNTSPYNNIGNVLYVLLLFPR